jgi:hypothetical protein
MILHGKRDRDTMSRTGHDEPDTTDTIRGWIDPPNLTIMISPNTTTLSAGSA